jgi:nicotinate-nucleotide adenylyltransferase
MDLASSGCWRVAFYGGTFDPPHLGHLAVARAARAALGLDTVLFAPVGAQPLKAKNSTASFEDRLAMTRLAIAEEPAFKLSLADAPKPSGAFNYTLDTLLGLRAELGPQCALFCLMGADSFASLKHWHRNVEIPFAANLIVASRPGKRLDDLKAALPEEVAIEEAAEAPELLPEVPVLHSEVEVRRYLLRNLVGATAPFYLLPGLDIEISASQVRERIRERIREQVSAAAGSRPAGEDLLPDAVAAYVRAHGLYR